MEGVDRILKIVANHSDGIPLSVVASYAWGDGYSDAEYQRTRRTILRHSEAIKTARHDGFLWCSPTPKLFDLITARQNSNTQDGATTSRDIPHELLNSINLLNKQGRDILLDRYRAYIDAIEDSKIILKRADVERDEYQIKDYATRFTDTDRSGRLWAKYQTAWERATEKYDRACVLTLTTDPKQHDSLADAWDSQSESWNRLMAFLSRESQLGYRPDYICVREPQEQGNPHIHAVIFGVSWLMSKKELSRYWNQNQGRIVHIEAFENRDGTWIQKQSTHDDDEGETDAKGYIGKYLSKLLDLTDLDSDDLALEDSETSSAWKLAIYWALNRRIYTLSQDLTDSDDPQTDAFNEIWEFYSACQASDIPPEVLRNTSAKIRAHTDNNDPPPESDSEQDNGYAGEASAG